ncbi:MAG: nucleotidyltransferase family protein [Bacteroidota bacterium]
MQCATILLSAGKASRFGSPKQLAQLHGRSLLDWAIHHTQAAGCDPIIVVSGAYPEIVGASLPKGILHLQNKEWRQGMLSTLQCGLRALLELGNWTHCLVFPTDMPWFTDTWIKTYAGAVSEVAQPSGIVASAYPAGPGLPFIFPKDFAEEILALPLDGKLRPALLNHPQLKTVPFGSHLKDVDRPEDLK